MIYCLKDLNGKSSRMTSPFSKDKHVKIYPFAADDILFQTVNLVSFV